jgi:hypothetical protein
MRINQRFGPLMLALVWGIGSASIGHAQVAVIDINAIQQGVQNEAQTIARLTQQTQQIVQQLQAARQTLQSVTGLRATGAALLETNPARLSLPGDFAQSLPQIATLGTSGGNPGLRGIYAGIRQSPCTSWSGSAGLQAGCEAVGMLAAVSTQTLSSSLASSQARLAQLANLSQQVASSTDAKGSLDLQARIAAEQTQLLAERTVLDQALQLAQNQLRLSILHQSDLGAQLTLQQGRSCYICP